jgi:transposase-like protein
VGGTHEGLCNTAEDLKDHLSDNDEGMRSLITWFLKMVMQLEAYQQVGANPYERTSMRNCHRNGSRSRSLTTRYRDITLTKPQFREKPYEIQVFGRFAQVEKDTGNAITESHLQGR